MEINDTQFNAELPEILSELQAQLHSNGVSLLNKTRDSGNDIMVQCPYHGNGQERKPSAGIRKSDGQFHCFACGETHSLQEVISYCFGHDEDVMGAFGWKWLLKNFLTVEVEERKDIILDLDRDVLRETNIEYVSEKELDSYRYYHPYMWKRKLTPEIVERFDIGYDKKHNAITFPVRDRQGNCLFIAYRSVVTKFFHYPVDVEKPVYGIYELYQLEKFPDEIIICESMLNALTCWVYGKYAVALNGTGTPYQYKQLENLPVRKYILGFDPDSAGEHGCKRITDAIYDKIFTKYVVPKNHDLNDLSREEFNNLPEIIY